MQGIKSTLYAISKLSFIIILIIYELLYIQLFVTCLIIVGYKLVERTWMSCEILS
jgi:hypothetical protein